MHTSALLRRVVPLTIVAMAIGAPTAAFSPTVTVLTSDPGDKILLTDMGARGGNIVVGADRTVGGERMVDVASSTNQGDTWKHELVYNQSGDARESQVTVCAGAAYMAYITPEGPGGVGYLRTYSRDLDILLMGYRTWTDSSVARKPDIACVANTNVLVAWFNKSGSGYHLKLRQQDLDHEFGYSQSFDLGVASMSRGVAITSTASRVYVAFFKGDELRVRRYSIASGGHHSLTSLGTTTVADLPYGNTPQIGADGDRVVLAYMHRADLKVRKSSNKGVSFGSSKTLADKPFPSEAGARPTTVAVRGSRVAIGSIEFSESSGKGVGYLSTNGGTSYTKQPSHSGGRLVAGLLKVGDTYEYAEAWDQSFSDPSVEHVDFMHK